MSMDKQVIETWLQALSEDPCGPDLEYDPSFMELAQAAAGKPETQFGPAEPPAWPQVRDLSRQLLDQSRDLRIALLWGRAAVNLDGVEALPLALSLLHGLLETFWDTLHPQPDPDDGDTFARISILSSLNALDGLLGDVRQAVLVRDRRLAGLRMRDVEVALERLPPRADEAPFTPNQISGMLGDAADLADRLRTSTDQALEALKALQSLMNDRFGIDQAVETKTLRGMLTGLQSLIPDALTQDVVSGDAEETDGPGADEPGAPGPQRQSRLGSAGLGTIETRQDAVRAIQMVCAFLERTEPTNPAQLLLRRAERLIDKTFLELVRDFAPSAVEEVARILGVDPNSLNDSGSY